MALEYKKSKQDSQAETRDMRSNPVMNYLKNQEMLRFNVGDILIKQVKYGEDWKTDRTPIGAPKKFMYVFENELGVGYIKQLKADGTGFTSYLQCVTGFDFKYNRLVLDPEYADHLLIGEDEFKYNAEHAYKKAFRKDAMDRNRKMLLKVKEKEKWLDEDVKAGDIFWHGNTFQDLVNTCYTVTKVNHYPDGKTVIEITNNGSIRSQQWDQNCIRWGKLSLTKPVPLEDALCGQPK